MQTLDNLKSVCEEILTEEDLVKLFQSGKPLKHYIGFEISGKVHLGTGLSTMLVIKELQNLGVETSVFLADWHSFINNKLGGDLKIIRELAVSYFKEALIASALCVGADPNKIKFVLANDLYKNDYWSLLVDVSNHITLSRAKRSVSIAGRSEGDDIPLSLLYYPAMQVADIFYQDLNIVHSATDQRKAHVIARTVFDKLRLAKPQKPVAIHQHLLLGLSKPDVWPIPDDADRDMTTGFKMSKSKPDSAVFIHDDPQVITNKINKAFCPPDNCQYNPILDWAVHLILPIKKEFILERAEKFGGTKKYLSRQELIQDFDNGNIHPNDLKPVVIKYLIDILQPAYKHFEQELNIKALNKLESIQITR